MVMFDSDEIRKILDDSTCDLKKIAKFHPDFFEALKYQYEWDRAHIVPLPTYISIPADNGVPMNTTILYRRFVPFLATIERDPRLLDSSVVDEIANPKKFEMTDSGIPADQLFGVPSKEDLGIK